MPVHVYQDNRVEPMHLDRAQFDALVDTFNQIAEFDQYPLFSKDMARTIQGAADGVEVPEDIQALVEFVLEQGQEE